MADLVSTEAKIAPIFPTKADIFTAIAAAAITAGQVVYINSAGKADLADASVAGTAGARGIALQTVGAGYAVNILKSGHLAGFTISQAYDARLFLSDTAGAVADAAGTVSTPIGRVVPMTDKDLTKVVFIDILWA